MKRARAVIGGIVVVVVAVAAPASAHETDQFTVPRGKELAEVGDFITAIYYDGIEGGVRETNEWIDDAVAAGRSPEYIEYLRSPEFVTHRVYDNYPSAVFMIDNVERHVHKNAETMRASPGRISGYWESIYNMFTGIYHPLDIRQLWRIFHSCTMQVFGEHFGPDKIGHFTDMGYVYFAIWRDARAAGDTEAEAMVKVMAEAQSGFVLGEEGMLGYLSAGVYSNADLAANYAGFKFYMNVTQPVKLKGVVRPPMILWNGEHWTVAAHVRRDSDFFSWFISEHWNEALNPGLWVPGMQDNVRDNVRDRAERILDFYRDDNGNRRTKAWFDAKQQELTTWFGEDYGHQGTLDELVTIGNTCFDPPPDEPDGRNPSGFAALHWGALIGDADVVRTTLDSGADVDTPIQSRAEASADWGGTALHVAAGAGHADIVSLLIDQGADIDHPNLREVTPLHTGVTHPDVVRILLDHDADVDAADETGRTPLHWLARYPDAASARLLLDHDAAVDATDNTGETPLHRAARWGHVDMVTMLLDAGAAVHAEARFRTTPMHFAVRQGGTRMIETLIAAGADVDAEDEFGLTPLHEAAREGRLMIAAALLAAGADGDRPDHYGSTPLHIAARYGHTATTRTLLDHGCDPGRANSSGAYPLHEAVFARRPETVSLLLEHGADPTTPDARGRTPIDNAQATGQTLPLLMMNATVQRRTADERQMSLN